MSTNLQPPVLIDGRNVARRVESLGLRCNKAEDVDLAAAKSSDFWLAPASFEGAVRIGDTTGEARQVALNGIASIATANGTIGVLLTPESELEPALWLAAPQGTVQVEAAGSAGVFKKRPTTLMLANPEGDTWRLELRDVARHYRSSKRFSPGQEAALLKAISR